MATLLIEGDPGAIRCLWAELDERNYLRGEFTVKEVEWNALAVPDLLTGLALARSAIASLDRNVLGIGGHGMTHWSIRDELVARLDSLIAKGKEA